MLNEVEMFYQRINALGIKIPVVDEFNYRYSVRYHCLVYYKAGDNYSQITVSEKQLIELSDKPEAFERSLLKSFSKMKSKQAIKNLEPNRYAGGYVARDLKQGL